MMTEEQRMLEQINGPIKEVIESEVKAGNSVVEVAGGWPLPAVNVWLKNRFVKEYSDLDVEYRLTNDPHYWYDEYQDKKNGFFVGTRY